MAYVSKDTISPERSRRIKGQVQVCSGSLDLLLNHQGTKFATNQALQTCPDKVGGVRIAQVHLGPACRQV